MKTRRQKDQVKGHEMHGLLPGTKMKVTSLNQYESPPAAHEKPFSSGLSFRVKE